MRYSKDFFLFIKPDAVKVHGGGNAESELLKREVQDQHWAVLPKIVLYDP